MKKIVGAVLALVLVTFLGLLLLAASAPERATMTAGTGCTVEVVPAAGGEMPKNARVAGYSGDQLANAAQIVAAGAALGLGVRDQTIGVMTAMGESSLHVLDYGDAVGPDSRGLFQQRANGAWGSYEDRMDPFTSATNFFKALQQVEGREEMEPTQAAHLTQRNADPDHYTRFWEPAVAVVAAVGGENPCAQGAAAAPGGGGQQLAQGLVKKIEAGTLTGLSSSVLDQIRWAAAGESPEQCGIDTRVLQIITIATDTFDSVGVSSINRLCTNTLAGAGTLSRHYVAGGGHAVDFYAFNGVPTTGAEDNAIKMIRAIDPLLPEGSNIGQVQCRAEAGSSLTTVTRQFDDTCNHLHIDLDPSSSTLLGQRNA